MLVLFCRIFVVISLVAWSTFGQTPVGSSQSPVLVMFEGQPAVKFETGKDYSTIAIIKKYEDEDAFMFFVSHNIFKKEITDYLYVTKTRVVYESPSKKNKSFTVFRNDIKKAGFDKIGLISSTAIYIFFIRTNKETKKFNIKFTPAPSKFEAMGMAQKPVFEFLESLINDFDTTSRPYFNPSNNSKEVVAINGQLEETQDLIKSNSSYDRFEDVTTNLTEIILSKPSEKKFEDLGGVFSLVTSYSFAGKTQTQIPENINLAFRYWVYVGKNQIYRDSFNDPTNLIILFDGERYKASMKKTLLVDALNRYVEIVSVSIPFEVFSRIANSKSVEIRVGALELALRDFQLEAIRLFLKKVKGAIENNDHIPN